jgi:lipopolysaccharide transport system permease protein
MKTKYDYKAALKDIVTGLLAWRVWLMLGWQDIRIRYRRSILGPFWLTLSMAITIYTMGFLYGHLFKMNLKEYFPYLAAGLLTWSFISTILMEGPTVFLESADFMKLVKLPYTVYVMRAITRNIIIFMHNTLAIVPLILYFHLPLGWPFLTIIWGLLVVTVAGISFSMILGALGARYRDLNPIITSLVQVAFFLTPILWSPKTLPNRYYFAINYNPFAQFVDLIREPILNHVPSAHTLFVTALLTVGSLAIAFLLLARSRRRIVFWM